MYGKTKPLVSTKGASISGAPNVLGILNLTRQSLVSCLVPACTWVFNCGCELGPPNSAFNNPPAPPSPRLSTAELIRLLFNPLAVFSKSSVKFLTLDCTIFFKFGFYIMVISYKYLVDKIIYVVYNRVITWRNK